MTRTSLRLGGVLVTVSSGSLHHKWCGIRGPDRGFVSFCVSFWLFVTVSQSMFLLCP
jgi:hypothetical protein